MPIAKDKSVRVQKFKSLDDMRKFYAELNSMQGEGEKISLDFNIDYYSEDVCASIVDVAEKTSRVGFKPHVQVHGNNLEFSKAEVQGFSACEGVLEQSGVEFFVSDGDNLYSLDETMSAYAKARAVADEIAFHDGSPFEKFIEIYEYVSSFIYKENKENKMSARDIISVLNGDDIVCVGYARILKYLCTAVGIDCKCVSSDLFDKEGNYISSHQCNLIYIKDEKYGIDGWYHADACWDSVKENGKSLKTYNYCLLPISDVKHHAQRNVSFYNEAELLYENQDDLFFDYFKDVAKLKRAMEFYDLKFDGAMPGVTVSDFNSHRNKAIGKLYKLFKENDIPDDVFAVTRGIGGILEIESLIALCMDYEKNQGILNSAIHMLKMLYAESKKKSAKNNNEYIIYNIYNHLDNRRLSKATVLEARKIREAQLVIKNENNLFEQIASIKSSSRPIAIKKYASAIKQNLTRVGMQEEDAKEMAKKSIIRTTKRAGIKFDDGASNMFKQKALTLASQKSS